MAAVFLLLAALFFGSRWVRKTLPQVAQNESSSESSMEESSNMVQGDDSKTETPVIAESDSESEPIMESEPEQPVVSEPEESSVETAESSAESSDHEHEFVEEVVEPTCLTAGYKVYTCSICGFKHKDESTTVPALGHDYQEYVTEATCTEDGYTLHICSRCQDQYTDNIVEAYGHSYTTSTLSPTCTESGYTITRCTRCGYSYTSDEKPALGHSYTAQVVPATHFAGGYTIYTCSVCGSSYQADETKQIPHDYKLTASAEPDCDTDGYRTYTCSCGDSYTDTIPALGHTWVEVSYVKNSDGTTTHYYSCSTCGADKKEVK